MTPSVLPYLNSHYTLFFFYLLPALKTMRLLLDISRCNSGLHLVRSRIHPSAVHRCVLSGCRRSLHVWSNGSGKPSPDHVGGPHRGPHRSTASVLLPHSSLGGLLRGCRRSQPLLEKPWTAGHTSVVFKSSSADATKERTLKTPNLPLEDLRRILKLAHPERLRLSGMCCMLLIA